MNNPSYKNPVPTRRLKVFGMVLLGLLLCSCRTAPKIKADHQVYIIIDDAGQALAQIRPFLQIQAPITIAVLPGYEDTRETARRIQNAPNKQLILHQPMEPVNPKIDPGPGAIFIDTPADEVAGILQHNMEQVPGAKGMNNHMGSRVTQDRERMEAAMAFCKQNGLFFIDSFTIPTSIAGQVARENGVPTAQQNVFLDDNRGAEAIRKQFEKGLRIAAERGSVVMIGHAWSPNTARVIQ
jgi:polysaccharide deacetylase 2 family uncharacterized protein YibQ